MGKTTLLRIAASVWGEDKYLKTWRTTSNGLEITCAKRSGTLLVLDEAEEAAKNNEHDDIITNIRDFLDTHGPARFAPIINNTMVDRLERDKQRPVANLASYWEMIKQKKVWLLTSAGLKEASKGRSTKRVVRALDEQKAFYDKGSGGETPKSRRTGYYNEQKKLYHIDYEKL